MSSLPLHIVGLLVLALAASGCQTVVPDDAPSADDLALLTETNTAINQQGRPCPVDSCLEDWPAAADLERLDYWDCKAYAVAKTDRLIGRHGFDPARLEYVLIEGPPLHVAHTALVVDGRWVLDSGLRCRDVCRLADFAAGVQITGRLPVSELPYLRQALRIARRH